MIGNGYPISALLGSEKIRAAAQSIFVTGSFWFAAVPIAASLATLRLIKTTNYLEHTLQVAEVMRAGIGRQAISHGFDIWQSGPSQMPLIQFEGDIELALGTQWTGLVMQRGAFLHPYHNMFFSSAHTMNDIGLTLQATDDAFEVLAKQRQL